MGVIFLIDKIIIKISFSKSIGSNFSLQLSDLSSDVV